MNAYGQILKAQLENSVSDLSPASTGLIYFNTSSTFIKIYNGTTWQEIVDTNTLQNISNKVIGTPSTDDVTIYLQDTEFELHDSIGTNRIVRFDSNLPGDNTEIILRAPQNVSTGATHVLEIVDTITVQTVLNKRTPIVLGGDAASASLQLQTSATSPKGHIKIVDGSDFLIGNQVENYISYINGLFPGAGDTSFTGNGVIAIVGGDAASFVAAAYNNNFAEAGELVLSHSRGTGAVPALLHTGDVIAQLNFSTMGTDAISHSGLATPVSIHAVMDDPSPTSSSLRAYLDFAVAPSGTVNSLSRFRINSTYSELRAGSSLRFNNAGNSLYTEFKVNPSLASSLSFTLPVDYGTTGQVLTSDGAGALSWTTASGGSGSKFSADWLTAAGTSKTITHGLGTTDISNVLIFDTSAGLPYEVIEVDSISIVDANNITLVSSEAPSVSWRVVISG